LVWLSWFVHEKFRFCEINIQNININFIVTGEKAEKPSETGNCA
jgi:hypothetical protein